jgi:hypothetical protein
MSNNPYRTLLTEMAAELDWSQQLLMDNRNATHPLADRARVLMDSRETPAPCIPPTYTPTVPSNSAERAQEFLDKFQEVYLASDDDKYVIATVIRMIAVGPDLVDLTESNLLDLANAISQL